MPTLYSGNQIAAALRALGFVYVSQKGSHQKWRRGPNVVIVPMHKQVLFGTFVSILKQAGIDKDTLVAAIR